MSFEPLLRARTLVEQVHERLLEAICNGDLASGERLIQNALADRLQVSRQPVIAALGLLRQQGFVVEHGRRGLQVAPLDRARLACIDQLRLGLEPLAARLAAEAVAVRTPAMGEAVDFNVVYALLARGRKAVHSGNRQAALRVDLAFHQWLCAASGNPLLAQSMQLHWLHLRRRAMAAHTDVLRSADWDEHAVIVEAIVAGDGPEAARRTHAHLGGVMTDPVSAGRSEPSAPAMRVRYPAMAAQTPD